MIHTDERIARATLLRISEPANSGLIDFVERVGAVQAVDDIRSGASIEGVEIDGLRHRLQTASGAADLESAARCAARLVCPGDEEWPTPLDDLGWVGRASFGLWVCGPLSLTEATATSVAIVGTRTATDYGASVAGDMAYELAERGWSVVSGLAYGIDTAAHRGVLSAGGTTVGVLACGIDVPYPKSNRPLYDRLAAEGLVVSEHPPGSAPQRYRFLVRNRIIAALSLGTVVVEMALRSGARSTASHAAALNRHVMCVPGPINSTMSGGCHRLLRERPETVQRMVAALAEAVYFVEKNPDKAKAAIAKAMRVKDEDALQSSFNVYAKEIVDRTMLVPGKSISDAVEIARDTGTIIRKKPEELYDNSFVINLEKSGFLKELWGGENYRR